MSHKSLVKQQWTDLLFTTIMCSQLIRCHKTFCRIAATWVKELSQKLYLFRRFFVVSFSVTFKSTFPWKLCTRITFKQLLFCMSHLVLLKVFFSIRRIIKLLNLTSPVYAYFVNLELRDYWPILLTFRKYWLWKFNG